MKGCFQIFGLAVIIVLIAIIFSELRTGKQWKSEYSGEYFLIENPDLEQFLLKQNGSATWNLMNDEELKEYQGSWTAIQDSIKMKFKVDTGSVILKMYFQDSIWYDLEGEGYLRVKQQIADRE